MHNHVHTVFSVSFVSLQHTSIHPHPLFHTYIHTYIEGRDYGSWVKDYSVLHTCYHYLRVVKGLWERERMMIPGSETWIRHMDTTVHTRQTWTVIMLFLCYQRRAAFFSHWIWTRIYDTIRSANYCLSLGFSFFFSSYFFLFFLFFLFYFAWISCAWHDTALFGVLSISGQPYWCTSCFVPTMYLLCTRNSLLRSCSSSLPHSPLW